jgi:hypothetical protein
MPAKWQQWMPFRIDAFKGSPAVQAMHPCARLGYLYLLSCAWQTEDCSLSADPMELAEKSGLGDELWALHGPRILRKFEWVDDKHTRLRNPVLYSEWLEAKRVFDARKEAADRTNSARSPKHISLQSPNGHRVGVLSEPLRSANTRTTVVPVDVDVSVPVLVDVLSPEMMARGLAERLGISLGYGPSSFNTAVTEVAASEQKAGRNLEDVCTEMEAAYKFYQQEKPTLRIHWGPANFFGQGHWRDPTAWPRKVKSRHEEITAWEPKIDED